MSLECNPCHEPEESLIYMAQVHSVSAKSRISSSIAKIADILEG
jgi:hypothetical protein